MFLEHTKLQCKIRKYISSHVQHVAGDHIQGGKTCLYKYFGGTKALFSYIHLQVTDSAEGKAMQNFSFGENAPVPPCRYVPVLVSINITFEMLKMKLKFKYKRLAKNRTPIIATLI